MQKIKEEPKLYTGCVKLYLDEIRTIVEFMQEIDKKGTLEIKVGGYQFSSLEELSKLKQKEHQSIHITYNTSSILSFISLSVDKESTFLHFTQSDDSLAFRGAFSSIERILIAHRRKWEWVRTPFYFATASTVTVLILYLLGRVGNNIVLVDIAGGLELLILITWGLYLLTIPFRSSKIILVDKFDESTFWKRNKDTIIISVISGIISFLIGVIGTLLVQSLGK